MAVSAFQLHDTDRNGIPSDVKCKLPEHVPPPPLGGVADRSLFTVVMVAPRVNCTLQGSICQETARTDAGAKAQVVPAVRYMDTTACHFVGDGVLQWSAAEQMPLGYDVPFPVIPSQCAPRSKCPWGTDWRGNPSLCRGGRLCPPCMTNAATGKRIATPVTRSLVRNDSASRCRGRRPRRPTP